MKPAGAASIEVDVRAGHSRLDRRNVTSSRPTIVWLSDPIAMKPSLVGAKAANIANAASAGLPVLPGFVITTAAPQRRAGMIMGGQNSRALATAWDSLSEGGTRSLVVRSSSTSEDGSTSSMAGMFESVIDVRDWKGFVRAIDRVLVSASSGLAAGSGAAPMAVLVQPHLAARVGGVMFGLDPLTGRADRRLVVASEEGPQGLVSGSDDGVDYLLSASGRAVRKPAGRPQLLSMRERRALTRLAALSATHFGGPQDIEWAIDRDGSLVMFQSRPVTAVEGTAGGPVLGPGPVAETFPNALAPLEIDLWVNPMRSAIEEALKITGVASARRIAKSPVVTTVGGRVAADLDLLGASPRKNGFLRRLNPLPPARKVAAAWRVGRLKAALGPLARRLVMTVDGSLAQVPDPSELTNEQLLNVLLRCERTLLSLHGYEVLAGMLTEPSDKEGTTSVGLGLRALALGRAEGLDDAQMVESSPEVLALCPPTILRTIQLPAAGPAIATDGPVELGARESLKLRIRWIQELSARCARELGRRLVPTGQLTAPLQVSLLGLDELKTIVAGGAAPPDIADRKQPASAPLPAAFQLSDRGAVVAIEADLDKGKGAGGGRGMGRIHQGSTPEHGDVLVVKTLDPGLAHLLPTLGGLVSETGNVLSHLAILAREFGVPTVVGLHGALSKFSEDAVVVVDGSSGEVFEVEET